MVIRTKFRCFILISILVFISCAIFPSVMASEPVSGYNALKSGNTDYDRALMLFSPSELREIQIHRTQMPVVANYDGEAIPAGSKSILSAVPYIGSERDQGDCGNCWVWASTGALEVAHNINNNVSERLSIQYFNSNWNNGSAEGNACRGGGAYDLAGFYNNTLHQAIPWSNTNASYADYFWRSGNISEVPASSIATVPNYPIVSVTASTLNFWSGQALAINNIKAEINAGVPIIYAFYLPAMGWNDFRSYWRNQSMDAVWDPDPYNATEFGGGHVVLIVGYNDTAAEPYWTVLNSWGIRENRPEGLFKLKMFMDYNRTSTSEGETFLANYFDIYRTEFQPPKPGAGSMSITSVPPDASIVIDGENSGYRTPQTLSDIPEGSHTLKLIKSGYLDYDQSITVESNKTTPVTAVLSLASSLSLASNPSGADIIIDNSSTGKKTHSLITGLYPGPHNVVMSKSGYEQYIINITTRAGTTTSFAATLKMIGGSIAVSSNPLGATIFVDQKDTGYQTPKTITGLSTGTHTLLLRKDLFQDWETSIQVVHGETIPVSPTLKTGGTNGSIFVYSSPSGANITVDGAKTQYTTSKKIVGIPAGQHNIMISKEGYQNLSQTIAVREGSITSVSGKLIK